MTPIEALVMLIIEYQKVYQVTRAKAKRLIRRDLKELTRLARRAQEVAR